MESFNFGAFDTNLGARIAAIPQEAQKQQTANMLQAMQMQGAMNQNELSKYTLASAQRSDASQNAVNAALKSSIVDGKINYDLLTSNLAGGAGASKIPDFLKARSEEEKRTQDIEKTKGDIAKQAREAVDSELIPFGRNAIRVTDVPSLTSHVKAFFSHPLLGKIASRFKTYEQALADDIKQISTPEGLRQWQTENANLTGKELTDLLSKVTTTTTNLGGFSRDTQRNAMGQIIGTPVDTPMTLTPGNIQAAADAKLSREQSERQFNAGGYTYDFQGGVRYGRDGVALPLMQQDPSAKGAAPVSGVPAGRNAPGLVPVGPRPEKPPTEYLREAKGIINTNYAINNLKTITDNFTAADMLNPARRAEIESAHSTAVLLAKDMFGLGVLNEGDERILRKIIPDPTAFSKGLVPIETIRKNLVLATNVINRMNETSAKVHKQPLLILDSITPSAPSPSAPPIQSFRRPG